ncbi:protein kinase domain-containing protein, partial [Nonomuraea sp. SBT364]|uniref:protein kinase domain-containing protein n=1 Tax=Nonomuraea sp. SBT364 TaxID=1580530 RepID=UPI0012E270DA
LGRAGDGRAVAIKVLQEGVAGDGRFAKEIDAARRVEPFCVAQVLDASLGPRPYIVTEYVDGPSLQEAGRHAGGDLRRLAVATATALAAVHAAGIVHRDFKPANVLLGRDGPRVIDFGVARVTDAALTRTSGVMGTPAYMAPEQLAGEVVGAAADVFAWGAVIVFAATGEPPFGQDALPAVINRILHNEPRLGDLQEPLRSIAYACLAKDPRARPAMQDVLLRLLGGPASHAWGGVPAEGPAVALAGGQPVPGGQPVQEGITQEAHHLPQADRHPQTPVNRHKTHRRAHKAHSRGHETTPGGHERPPHDQADQGVGQPAQVPRLHHAPGELRDHRRVQPSPGADLRAVDRGRQDPGHRQRDRPGGAEHRVHAVDDAHAGRRAAHGDVQNHVPGGQVELGEVHGVSDRGLAAWR